MTKCIMMSEFRNFKSLSVFFWSSWVTLRLFTHSNILQFTTYMEKSLTMSTTILIYHIFLGREYLHPFCFCSLGSFAIANDRFGSAGDAQNVSGSRSVFTFFGHHEWRSDFPLTPISYYSLLLKWRKVWRSRTNRNYWYV